MGFVLFHMIGNLKLFISKERAEPLRRGAARHPRPLAPAHGAAVDAPDRADRSRSCSTSTPRTRSRCMNRKARPDSYQSPRDYVAADFASRTMRWTGIIVAALPDLPPARSHVGQREPGVRARRSVQQPGVQPRSARRSRSCTSSPTSRSRSTCTTARWSLFQSLGINNPKYNEAPATVRAGIRRAHPPRQPDVPDRGAARSRRAGVPAHRSGRAVRRGVRAVTLDSRSSRRCDSPTSGTTTSSAIKLVNPANKRRFDIIVVGTGLAGASAAASLG